MFNLRMFDNETVKNVIISKNPRLTRVAEFISPYWMNLEYLEMSYMGVAFGQNAREILQDIFRYYRTKVCTAYEKFQFELVFFKYISFSAVIIRINVLHQRF